MGTLYRIVDHKNKLYYDMDKWCVWTEVMTSVETLIEHLVTGPAQRGEEAWRIDMGRAIVRDVQKNMTFPLDRAYDAGDDYYDIEEEGYKCCGDRFSSGNNVSTPYDPLPTEIGTYYVWTDYPFSASLPEPTRMHWNGAQWKSTGPNDWGLAPDVPVWWASLDNSDITERLK